MDNFELDIDFDIDFDFINDNTENALIIPKAARPKSVKYQYAHDFAGEIDINHGTNYYAIVSGNFIFGDFLEALIERHNINFQEIYISTLGMNENNVDSIKNISLIAPGRINLIASHYFFSVERHNLVPYMLNEYAGANIKVAVAGSHMKTALIKTDNLNLVMAGSANLSSSNSIEQFNISNDPVLYDFNKQVLDTIMENYTVFDGMTNESDFTRDKENTGRKLWRTINNG